LGILHSQPVSFLGGRKGVGDMLIGVQTPSDFGGGEPSCLKNYTMPEYVSVKIAIQTHSTDCRENKTVDNSHMS